MSGESTPYFSPAAFGLEIVADIDQGPGHAYDMFVVWRSRSGRWYYATDAGSHGRAPFAGYASTGELTAARDDDEVIASFRRWASLATTTAEQRAGFVASVRGAKHRVLAPAAS